MFGDKQYKTLDDALDALKASVTQFQDTVREIRNDIANNGQVAADPEPSTRVTVRPTVEITNEAALACYNACRTVVGGYEGDYAEEEMKRLGIMHEVNLRVCKDAIALVDQGNEQRMVTIKPEAKEMRDFVDKVVILLRTHHLEMTERYGIDRNRIRNEYMAGKSYSDVVYQYYDDKIPKSPPPYRGEKRGRGRPRKQ